MILLSALPALLLMAIIFGWPLLRYAWLSGHADSVLTGLVPVANGGANWLRLLSDQRFWVDALQTARFGVVSVGIELILAMAIALLLDQRWRGRGAVRALTLMPWALPTTMMALGWRWIQTQVTWPAASISCNLLIYSDGARRRDGTASAAWVAYVFRQTEGGRHSL